MVHFILNSQQGANRTKHKFPLKYQKYQIGLKSGCLKNYWLMTELRLILILKTSRGNKNK